MGRDAAAPGGDQNLVEDRISPAAAGPVRCGEPVARSVHRLISNSPSIEQSMARTARHQRAPLGRPQRRILVADDDPEMRSLVCAALQADGYEVESAHDGAELLQILADAYLHTTPRQYDLIITDHRMPRIKGMEVIKGLRGGHGPPVILMTAFGGPEMRHLAKELGAAAVFDKPFEMDDLRTAVEFIFSEAYDELHGDSH